MGAIKSKFLKLISKIKNKSSGDEDIDCTILNINSSYFKGGRLSIDSGHTALNSNKTIYRGNFEENIPAAVTRIPVENTDLKKTKRELNKLKKKLNRETLPDKLKRLISVNKELISCDENIAKYFGHEIHAQSLCVFVAFELCDHTIDDYLRNTSNFPLLNLKDVTIQLVKGINYLHEIKVLHRNLKPSKVLIKIKQKKAIVKICGFGVSKPIPDNQSDFSNSGEYGEPGYIAPEIYDDIENSKQGKTSNKCYTKGSDIFQLGAVIGYIQSNGNHVYNCQQAVQSKCPGDFSNFEGDFTLRVLVRDEMLAFECSNRPSAKDILKHPAFWSSTDILAFFHQTKELLKDQNKLQSSQIEGNATNVLSGGSWKIHLTHNVKRYLFYNSKKHVRSYDEKSVLGLICCIRNMREHFREFNNAATKEFGSPPIRDDKYLDYWTKRFPQLLYHTYNCMKVHSGDDEMERFYK